jgi:small subunit ribosomal protein S17
MKKGMRLSGVVISDAMDKTVNVLVERRFMHKRFKKIIKRSKKFMAHDAENQCRVGDKVRIRESRPLSRHKRWVVEEILDRKEIPGDDTTPNNG